MPSYLIHERMTCEVTFVRRITADDETDALNGAFDGDGELLGVSVGDSVPGREETDILPDAPHIFPGVFYPEPVGPSLEKLKLEAIRARLAGEWDNPVLMSVGPLAGTLDDIRHILALETLTTPQKEPQP